MMRFAVVTLCPEMLASWSSAGLLGKAVDAGRVKVRTLNPRDYARDKHRSVDDAPYGGGSGMVLMPEPIVDALEADDAVFGAPRPLRVLLTPQGRSLGQRDIERYANLGAVSLVCGRYEGIDDRVRNFVDEEISLGDFVLFGGEVGAMAVIEATSRLVPGVLGNQASLEEESHTAGLLEYPQYTRPRVFRGMEVPSVLTSGHHAAVRRWRRKEALRRTRARRPDMVAKLELSAEDRELIEELAAEERTERGRE